MKLSLFISTRTLLLLCNFMLMACGILLVIAGFLLLCDWPRVLLSRLILPVVGSQSLPQPPLYYVALVLLGVGLIICSAAVLGCWSACVFNYCILTVTFLIVITLLLSECVMYGMVWLWPNCLGLGASPNYLARTLQRSYGKSGFEQYTAAVDLAQANFKCCGISSPIEYDTSVWRLQAPTPNKQAVPLTCCTLVNVHELMAYMNPSPVNTTRCQAVAVDSHKGYRHNVGCIFELEQWYRHQYVTFLAVGLLVLLVEFCVLLGILLACTRVHKYRRTEDRIESLSPKVAENIYENERPGSRFRQNDAYTLSRSFRQNYRINDDKP